MRIVLAGFIIVLLVLCGGLAVRYNQDASVAREELNGERYLRMTAEEGLQKANQQVSSLNKELIRVQSSFESTETALKRTKAINADLKERLNRAAKIQLSLDKKITELQQMVGAL